jgi:hypothetical protein
MPGSLGHAVAAAEPRGPLGDLGGYRPPRDSVSAACRPHTPRGIPPIGTRDESSYRPADFFQPSDSMWSLGSAWGGPLFVSRSQASRPLRGPRVCRGRFDGSQQASADPKPPGHCEFAIARRRLLSLMRQPISALPAAASRLGEVLVSLGVQASADPSSPGLCEQ